MASDFVFGVDYYMIRIITDSSSDISPERAEKLGIDLLPLTVIFGEEHFKSNLEITNKEFYERLATVDKLPTTAQVTPAEFEDIFRKYVEAGDDIVGLFISAKMSGTYQSALVAKDIIGASNIHIVETATVTFALGLIVEEAVKMRDRGLSAAEMEQALLEMIPRVTLYAAIEDLKYLRMGGRLSATSAIVASILGICPCITIKDGLVEVVGKARGKKAAFNLIDNLLKKSPPSLDYDVSTGHTNSPENMAAFDDYFAAELKRHVNHEMEIGSIVGTHVGPGACGIAYVRK